MSPFDQSAAAREQKPGGIAHEVGELHRLLIESAQDYAIFALDPDGYVLSWNAGAQRFKGYSPEEVTGRHFSIFYPPSKVAEGWPAHELHEAARLGRFEDEGWRVRKDGSRFWANVVITPLYDDVGHLVGYGKVTRDLTERRANEQRALDDAGRVASEEAARRVADVSRERIQQLQELTSQLAAVHTIDDIQRVLFTRAFPMLQVSAGSVGVVDSTARLLRIVAAVGYEPRLDPSGIVPLDEDFPMARAISEERPMIFRTRDERDSRFPFTRDLLQPFDESVVLPLMRGGRAMGALAMHRTVADRSEPLSDETLAFMGSLAQQCGQALERVTLYDAEQRSRQEAESARERAEEALVRAEQANRAKGEFLAAMSHELRTPLNAIGGYAQILEMGISGAVSQEQRQHLVRIQRSQQHLLGLINDILNFARVDAGQVRYELEAVPMHEVLGEVMDMVAPQAAMKGLELRVTACDSALVAWADRSKVEQVVLNMLSNAVKFTDAGGRVSVGCARATSGGVECAVSDTGSGIPTDQLDHIFEPFVQVGRSLSSTHEGTGLGLAISRNLARAMGGDITVQSVVGEGSTFLLVLPAVDTSFVAAE